MTAERRLFFRLDDVDELTPAVRALVELFVARKLPLHCAVIPGRASPETARFLLASRERFPGIEFGTHGWMHEERGWGEFGGNRPYDAQRADIEKGRARMRDLFGEGSAPVFTPPWGKWNRWTPKALADAGYRILSAGFPDSRRQRWLGPAARALGLATIGRVPVSYHPGPVASSGLREISVSVDVAADGEDLAGAADRAAARTPLVGVLLHPPDAAGPQAAGRLSTFLDACAEKLWGAPHPLCPSQAPYFFAP